ncbi:hypothetical protein ACSOQX_003934 [Yersinia enterocolitica]|nr:hypothetical protein [Yersinia enterocolitica]EKN5104365.1 hypothetical protein [Yersinia enterocolitica]
MGLIQCRHLNLLHVAVLCLTMMGGGNMALAGTHQGVLTLKAALIMSACTIQTDNPTYTLEDTNAAEIWGNGSQLQTELTKVQLTLTNCGLGNNTLKPKVTIIGTKATAPDVLNSNEYMFRDSNSSGGTSSQFFIAIAKKATPTGFLPADLYKINENLTFKTPPKVGDSGNQAQVEMWLGVGSALFAIDKSNAKAGTVHATITLQMEYQ